MNTYHELTDDYVPIPTDVGAALKYVGSFTIAFYARFTSVSQAESYGQSASEIEMFENRCNSRGVCPISGHKPECRPHEPVSPSRQGACCAYQLDDRGCRFFCLVVCARRVQPGSSSPAATAPQVGPLISTRSLCIRCSRGWQAQW
jgi:hypothetical protein